MPIKQFLYFDAIECLCDNNKLFSNFVSPFKDQIVSKNGRYYSQEMIFGKDFQNQLGQLKLFVTGCGAMGCEILKNFSMMGIGCTEQNGVVFIADTNLIKRSDLNQNFHFRSSDIGVR
jgi:ubiquitin-activating enzyme E1